MTFALLQTLSMILTLVWWVFLIMIIMSWLISFNVVNGYNPTVRTIWNALLALTEPLLRPIRRTIGRILPDLRGIDISPIFLLLGLTLVEHVIIGNLKDLFR